MYRAFKALLCLTVLFFAILYTSFLTLHSIILPITRWISILGKQGEAIFGMPATKLSEYLSMDPAQFDAIVAQSTNKIVDLRVRAKYEINQTDNSLTVRCQALNAQEVDIVEESKSMLAELSKLSV